MRVKVTKIIIVVNVLMFVLLTGMSYGVNIFGNSWEYTVINHEWYRLVTAMFVHIGVLHLLCNVVSLAQLGMVLEEEVGSKAFLLSYLLSGIGANIASMMINGTIENNVVSAGASGAICGLLGIYIVYVRRNGADIGYIVRMAMPLVIVGLFANVDNVAHGAGITIGILLGNVLSNKKSRPNKRQREWIAKCELGHHLNERENIKNSEDYGFKVDWKMNLAVSMMVIIWAVKLIGWIF